MPRQLFDYEKENTPVCKHLLPCGLCDVSNKPCPKNLTEHEKNRVPPAVFVEYAHSNVKGDKKDVD